MRMYFVIHDYTAYALSIANTTGKADADQLAVIDGIAKSLKFSVPPLKTFTAPETGLTLTVPDGWTYHQGIKSGKTVHKFENPQFPDMYIALNITDYWATLTDEEKAGKTRYECDMDLYGEKQIQAAWYEETGICLPSLETINEREVYSTFVIPEKRDAVYSVYSVVQDGYLYELYSCKIETPEDRDASALYEDLRAMCSSMVIPETVPDPTPEPTSTPEPTPEPTPAPTAEPTPAPTAEPTQEPEIVKKSRPGLIPGIIGGVLLALGGIVLFFTLKKPKTPEKAPAKAETAEDIKAAAPEAQAAETPMAADNPDARETETPTAADKPDAQAETETHDALADERPKFCANCGAPLPEEGRFCPKCGKPIA